MKDKGMADASSLLTINKSIAEPKPMAAIISKRLFFTESERFTLCLPSNRSSDLSVLSNVKSLKRNPLTTAFAPEIIVEVIRRMVKGIESNLSLMFDLLFKMLRIALNIGPVDEISMNIESRGFSIQRVLVTFSS